LADLFGSFTFVVFVITDCLCLDAEVIKQHARPARVFAGDQIDLGQNAQCPLSNIFEITDGRRDNEEGAGHDAYCDILMSGRANGAGRSVREGNKPQPLCTKSQRLVEVDR
ncbi:MAG: hypothetical protein QOH42_1204, partial [Blastocatellia bacterium]|nr:hypothetical protein [Blastocatellia bacterium]